MRKRSFISMCFRVLTLGFAAVMFATSSGAQAKKPNVVYFLVDNLGMGELSAYSGGPYRGVYTTRIDAFAKEGMMLLNFAPEAQCTPTRSALMTGRYSIRSGNQTVALAGSHSGLVKWERTLGDIFSDAGYATAIVGKWHIGDAPGRWPTDHGFDEWYGIPHSYDESLWPDDPWYDPKRDGMTRVLEGRKGQPVHELEQLTVEVRRNIDVEYMKRAESFLKRSTEAGKPFFLYFDHSMMHLPTIPRAEFKGKTGRGEWADSLLELDTDFGTLLDYLNSLGAAGNTIIIFSGDNGPEEAEPWRGTAGYFEGSYFTGMEGSLRTPAIVRYPGHVPAGQKSNDIVHVTDMFTTLLLWAGLEGRNFKLVMVEQRTLTDPALPLPNPHLINLDTDPKEREPVDYPYLHTWVGVHIAKILQDYQESVKRESLIPVGAPLDFVPKRQP